MVCQRSASLLPASSGSIVRRGASKPHTHVSLNPPQNPFRHALLRSQVGSSATIADVAVLTALLSLYTEVLGGDVQQRHAGVTRWLQACAEQPQFAAVLGG